MRIPPDKLRDAWRDALSSPENLATFVGVLEGMLPMVEGEDRANMVAAIESLYAYGAIIFPGALDTPAPNPSGLH